MTRAGGRTYDVVVGIDPGYRDTGYVVLRRGAIVAAGTVHREEPAQVGASLTDGGYLDGIVDAIERDLDDALIELVDLVAVEDVVAPNPHAHSRARHGSGSTTINPTGIIATAVTAGYVIAWARSIAAEVVKVRPGKNGSGPSGLYPPELLDRGGIARPGGNRRHERSALDVARVFAGYRP